MERSIWINLFPTFMDREPTFRVIEHAVSKLGTQSVLIDKALDTDAMSWSYRILS